MVKKTRPERPEKPLPPGAVAQKGGELSEPPATKFNPYMVKEVPDKPSNSFDATTTTLKGAARPDKPKVSR
jgi:hypothetical protein